MKPILEVQNISKQFFIGGPQERYLSLRDIVANPFKKFTQEKPGSFWALEDINFTVMPGESLGIIGRNGAGKSTLLKILSRITPPTSGKIVCRGRVASLLEVGTGFHPELTGRENVYMNGSILGMRKAEIDKHFDAIIDFSGVEQFLDTPLKRYSSGMQLRLAFAVAAHLEPEILVIDEVLAVGDAEFQKKCLGKMDEVSRSGRTVLFVSHNMDAVSSLTQKSIILNQGKIMYTDTTEKVLEKYFQTFVEKDLKPVWENETENDEAVHFIAARFENETGRFNQSDPIAIEIKYKVKSDLEKIAISINLSSSNETVLFGSFESDTDYSLFLSKKAGTYISKITVPPYLLHEGKYFIRISSGRPHHSVISSVSDALIFEVYSNNYDNPIFNSKRGAILPKLQWKTQKLD